MSPSFEAAFAMILRLEGADTNDPRDPGGHTRFGIAQASHPDVDVATLTREGAAAIYHREYWKPLRCDDMPAGLALAVFDCAVNQGPGIAVRLLQRSAGVPEDGIIGMKTLGAAAARTPAVIVAFMARRAARYADTNRFDVYGHGWLSRLFVVHREAVKLEASDAG